MIDSDDDDDGRENQPQRNLYLLDHRHEQKKNYQPI